MFVVSHFVHAYIDSHLVSAMSTAFQRSDAADAAGAYHGGELPKKIIVQRYLVHLLEDEVKLLKTTPYPYKWACCGFFLNQSCQTPISSGQLGLTVLGHTNQRKVP